MKDEQFKNIPWEFKMMVISMTKCAVVMRKAGGDKEAFLKCASEIWDCNSKHSVEDLDHALAQAMIDQTGEMLKSMIKDEE